MLVSRSPAVREGADSVIVFTGDPNLLVVWAVTGPGTLTDPSPYTNESGIASALYTPGAGSAGQAVTIRVTYRKDA